MIKVIAIGDVHGQWAEAWLALKASNACDAQLNPTEAVVEGRFQVVFMGDLVHYKDARAYAQAVGEEPYDPQNHDHLRRAAKAQIRELYRFKDYVDKANGNVRVILGNHDESALDHKFELSTRGGLKHDEFNEAKGGIKMPEDLAAWMGNFEREILYYDVQFCHAGPTPGMQYFDDFFYHDTDTKTWWYNKPELLKQTGYRFGVYGHTVMKEGIWIDKEHHFAMIDALGHRQFFEMILAENRLDYRVIQF
ncbi:MAG: metallophosphoesterase [Trueperaceae bacterium]|nr:metallophosphoesterase [Trueperaceae bacterium]